MEKYVVLSFVGEGSFGRVFKAKDKDTHEVVALKVIRKKGRSPNDLKNLRQECDIQRQLQHPNIIHMIDSFDTDIELVVVTEFAEKELHSILGREGCLTETRTREITWDLVSALYYLHSHRVLHRDLKPQNVLIDSNGHAKLCDFGLARNMTAATHVLTSIKGTPLYMAPELIDEKPYDHQADLWSLGCIVYELMAGQPPFCTTSIVKLVQMIRHKSVQWPTFISPEAFSFLQGLLHKDPANRLPWPEILKHPFVAGHILILPQDENIVSPFTKPLTHSQNEAKQLQKDKINSIHRLSIQAARAAERRELEQKIQKEENMITSDDDSVRAASAFSVRDSLKTDDEDSAYLLSPGHAKLLVHEFKNMNTSNLVVCNLQNNLAQFENNTIKEEDEIKPYIEPKESPKKNRSKRDSPNETASQSMENPKSSIKSGSDASSGLSKSVPPSYKQKFLQFSREKLGLSGGGNKLTRSLRRSFTFKSWDKGKSDSQRRTSEPNVDACKTEDSSSVTQKEIKDKTVENIEKLGDSSSSDRAFHKSPTNNSRDSNSPPSVIEQEEWRAFLKSSTLEVMDGDLESLTQLNMVKVVVNMSCGGAKVCCAVGSLLALPAVSPNVSRHTLLQIQDVFLEANVLDSFIIASKRLLKSTPNNEQESEAERLSAVASMQEVCAWLCVRSCRAVQQYALALKNLKADDLVTLMLSLYPKSPRLVLSSVGILITILQDLPEHSDVVEQILFEKDKAILVKLLNINNDSLKLRLFILISLLSSFCCRSFSVAMDIVWHKKHTQIIESYQSHCNVTISRAAKQALKELSTLPFFED